MKEKVNNLIGKIRQNSRLQMVLFFAVLLSIPVAVNLAVRGVRLFVPASGVEMDVFYQPQEISVPPEAVSKIYIDTKGERTVFARVVYTFDKNKVMLSREVETTNQMSDIIAKTSMVEANGAGRGVIVLAVPPGAVTPSGVFEYATLTFTNVSTTPNDSTTLGFDKQDSQIVQEDQQEAGLNTSSATVRLNTQGPSATPTRTPTRTPTPRYASPTPSPYIPVPTSTPKPTATSTPVLASPTPIVPSITPQGTTCSSIGGTCKFRCFINETEKTGYSCSNPSYKCCVSSGGGIIGY